MPMWGGYWGGPWAGLSWLFPVIGLLFMAMMMCLCVRMMGMKRPSPEGGHIAHRSTEIAGLRREAEALREEVRKLRERE